MDLDMLCFGLIWYLIWCDGWFDLIDWLVGFRDLLRVALFVWSVALIWGDKLCVWFVLIWFDVSQREMCWFWFDVSCFTRVLVYLCIVFWCLMFGDRWLMICWLLLYDDSWCLIMLLCYVLGCFYAFRCWLMMSDHAWGRMMLIDDD